MYYRSIDLSRNYRRNPLLLLYVKKRKRTAVEISHCRTPGEQIYTPEPRMRGELFTSWTEFDKMLKRYLVLVLTF